MKIEIWPSKIIEVQRPVVNEIMSFVFESINVKIISCALFTFIGFSIFKQRTYFHCEVWTGTRNTISSLGLIWQNVILTDDYELLKFHSHVGIISHGWKWFFIMGQTDIVPTRLLNVITYWNCPIFLL